MGGHNEKVLTPATSGKDREIQMGSKIRVHENAGEVHFHDDEKKLKVAIPAADFWREWTAFQTTRIAKKDEVLHFIDPTRGTVALIESQSKFKDGKYKIDVNVSIVEVEVSPVVSSLRDFAANK